MKANLMSSSTKGIIWWWSRNPLSTKLKQGQKVVVWNTQTHFHSYFSLSSFRSPTPFQTNPIVNHWYLEITDLYNSICGLLGLLYLKPMEQLYDLEANISRCNKNFIFQSINCQTSKWRVWRLVDYDNKLLREIGTISGLLGEKKTKGQYNKVTKSL